MAISLSEVTIGKLVFSNLTSNLYAKRELESNVMLHCIVVIVKLFCRNCGIIIIVLNTM